MQTLENKKITPAADETGPMSREAGTEDPATATASSTEPLFHPGGAVRREPLMWTLPNPVAGAPSRASTEPSASGTVQSGSDAGVAEATRPGAPYEGRRMSYGISEASEKLAKCDKQTNDLVNELTNNSFGPDLRERIADYMKKCGDSPEHKELADLMLINLELKERLSKKE